MTAAARTVAVACALAAAVAATCPAGASAATLHACPVRQTARGPYVRSVRVAAIPCNHATGEGGWVGNGEGLRVCSVASCVDRWDVLSRASGEAPLDLGRLPVGVQHSFPPYLFHVRSIRRVGRVLAELGPPERWTCSAVYWIVPQEGEGGGWPEWVDVLCHRAGATVAVRLGD